MTVEFVYNADGLRVQKTVNGVATKYTLHGKNIVHMTSGTDELHFFYDAQNRPTVVVYNGVPYAYVKSLQGDVIAILDAAGNVVVSYVYDAWGAPIGKSGALAETLGKVQPFRYRGYVFDEETGLYYLRSRYYNPRWGRFANADNYILADNGKGGVNIFLYCNNSPISNCDRLGTETKTALDITDPETAEAFAKLIEEAAGFDHVGNAYTSFRYYERVDGREIHNAEAHNNMINTVVSLLWYGSTFSAGFFGEGYGFFKNAFKKLAKDKAASYLGGLASTIINNFSGSAVIKRIVDSFSIQDGGYISYFVEYRTDYNIGTSYANYEIREYSQTDRYTGITKFTYEVWYRHYDSLGHIAPYQKIGSTESEYRLDN